jgi:hypothetical protein
VQGRAGLRESGLVRGRAKLLFAHLPNFFQ